MASPVSRRELMRRAQEVDTRRQQQIANQINTINGLLDALAAQGSTLFRIHELVAEVDNPLAEAVRDALGVEPGDLRRRQ